MKIPVKLKPVRTIVRETLDKPEVRAAAEALAECKRRLEVASAKAQTARADHAIAEKESSAVYHEYQKLDKAFQETLTAIRYPT